MDKNMLINFYTIMITIRFDIKNKENKDIVLPGLGFIKCTKPLEVTIYTKDNIIPRIRDNLI